MCALPPTCGGDGLCTRSGGGYARAIADLSESMRPMPENPRPRNPRRSAPLQPTPSAFTNMHGNVWEWTTDCYNSTYVEASPDGQPTLQGLSTRPSGWVLVQYRKQRSRRRASSPAAQRRDILGFRVARILDAR